VRVPMDNPGIFPIIMPGLFPTEQTRSGLLEWVTYFFLISEYGTIDSTRKDNNATPTLDPLDGLNKKYSMIKLG
jgi:hypothetical protein